MKFFGFAILLFIFSSIKANDISVLTYNVNYSFINDNIIDILDSLDADVVCLQETNAKWEKIIREGLNQKYPYILFKHYGTAGGLATLSKYPIIKTNYLKNEVGWFPGWWISIKKEQDTLQLLNTHLKPGLTRKGRIGWNAYFKAEDIHIEEIKHFTANLNNNLPTIILGDFNENDNGKMIKHFHEKMNFKDALSMFDKKSKTWRWILLRGRYDHIVYNNLVSCTNAIVYKLGKSDHLPVIGKFKFN